MFLKIEFKAFENSKIWYEELFQFMRDNWGWVVGVLGIICSILGALFYVNKAVHRKRAAAVGGFYSQLKSYLQPLIAQLVYKKRINNTDEKEGNIYLIEYRYDDELVTNAVPRYSKIEDTEINIYKQAAESIIKIIETSENNVPPLWSRRKTWEGNLNKVVSICRTIAYPCLQGYKEITNSPTYIKDGKELWEAFNYIQRKLP